MKNKKFILASIFVIGFFIPVFIVQAQASDHLLITQAQITGGPGKTANDFVEIHNPTNNDIDLKGYRLVKRTKTATTDTAIKSWTATAIISAGGFYLWANSDYLEIVPTPAATTTATLAEDNGIALRQGPANTGTIIDAVVWGAATNAFVEGSVFGENPGAGMALKRKADNIDTNDNSQDFSIAAAAPRNTPGSVGQGAESENPPAETNQPPTSSEATAEQPGQAPTHVFEDFYLQISEFLPNPKGGDAGEEWAELYNSSGSEIDLSAWILDDSGGTVGKNAYVFPSPTLLSAGKYLGINLPSGAFTLNNTGGDCLRLLSPEEILSEEICYEESAAEGKSYVRDSEGGYMWTDTPTFGLQNIFPVDEISAQPGAVVINEVLPDPEGDEEEEFIELKNLGEEELDLSGWKIGDATRKFEITQEAFDDTVVAPNGFFVVPREVSKIALNNTGKESVVLFDPLGREMDSLSYEQAKEGAVYAREAEGSFVWSAIPTPGAENNISKISAGKKSGVENLLKNSEVLGASIARVTPEQARLLPLGAAVEITGDVSASPGVLGKNVFYLSGSGIRVSLSEGELPELVTGDRVTLTGELATFHDELQVKIARPDDLVWVSRQEAPQPARIATGEIGENFEGHLVRLAGKIVENSGSTIFINDGSGTARIYIMDSTGINKPVLRKGDTLVVTGIVSQYDENYRVLPRSNSDLDSGSIKSGQTGLPRTGVGYWLGVLVLIASILGFFEFFNYFPKWLNRQ